MSGVRLRQVSSKPKHAVYTCLFGYSELFADHALPFNSGIDHICFTDDCSLRSKVWQVCTLDSTEFGPMRTAKMVKLLAHRFLADYETSLYVDNTIKLIAPPAQIFQYLRPDGSPMVCFAHPDRDCVYAEAEMVCDVRLDDPDTVALQMSRYRAQGHPEHAGLIAAGMMLRRHHDPSLCAVMEQWFEEVRQYSHRDQLSFNVIARRNRFAVDHFPGMLTANELMQWPVVKGFRLPRTFCEDRYLKLNPDIAGSGMNPRKHYILYGAHEGRPYE
jgi:hypothetical protein